MHLYDSRVERFIPNASSGQIADIMALRFLDRNGVRATEAEIRS